jgi:hypothetical protein
MSEIFVIVIMLLTAPVAQARMVLACAIVLEGGPPPPSAHIEACTEMDTCNGESPTTVNSLSRRPSITCGQFFNLYPICNPVGLKLSFIHKQSNMVESYIIRIYRRTDSDPRQVVGTAECALDGRRWHFSTIQQLWEVLVAPNVADDGEIAHAHQAQDR